MGRKESVRMLGRWAGSIAGMALLLALAPRTAAAQEDILKFSSSGAALILIQVHADKMSEFEQAWAGIRGAVAKSDNPDMKAYGESLGGLSKVDQPPIDTPAGKAIIYVLQLPSPSTIYTYNPVMFLYEVLWKNGQEGAILNRAEADAIYEKFKAAVQNINPPWKLIKVS